MLYIDIIHLFEYRFRSILNRILFYAIIILDMHNNIPNITLTSQGAEQIWVRVLFLI